MTNTKKKPDVHNIQTLKELLDDDVCYVRCFTMHSLIVTLLQEYLEWARSLSSKKSLMITFLEMLIQDLLWTKAIPGHYRKSGFKAMVFLFNGTQSDDQESLQYGFLRKKVTTKKTFVKIKRLPPATSHSRQTYLQVMHWMGKNDGNNCTE